MENLSFFGRLWEGSLCGGDSLTEKTVKWRGKRNACVGDKTQKLPTANKLKEN